MTHHTFSTDHRDFIEGEAEQGRREKAMASMERHCPPSDEEVSRELAARAEAQERKYALRLWRELPEEYRRVQIRVWEHDDRMQSEATNEQATI